MGGRQQDPEKAFCKTVPNKSDQEGINENGNTAVEAANGTPA